MTIKELPETMRVVDETEAVEWLNGRELRPGYLIANDRFETLTHVAKDTLAGMTVTMLEDVTAQGKNIDHITRITGYMSKTSGWNKGKQAELRDRHRTTV